MSLAPRNYVWNASARPARSTDTPKSSGMSAHGLPAQTGSEMSSSFFFVFFFKKKSQNQCTACPLSLTAGFIVSQGLPAYCVLHKLESAWLVLSARLTCLLAPRFHSERQCTACPPPLTPSYHSERQRTACPLILWESRIRIAIV